MADDVSMVSIPRTEQWEMTSNKTGRSYRIYVAKPLQEAPPEGFPIMYVLDGNAMFGTMVESVRLQSRAQMKTGVAPAIVVAIGYQSDEPFDKQRFIDFTLPTPLEELPKKANEQLWPELGGAEGFLAFIEQELKPEVERKYPVDRNRQAIFGHSLGGLFVLQVMLTRPEAFQTYLAGSPSIHWNKTFILDAQKRFIAQIQQQEVKQPIQTLIAVGELEKHHFSGMNANAQVFVDELAPCRELGMRVEFYEFEGESHISVLPVLISRAVRFALKSVESVE